MIQCVGEQLAYGAELLIQILSKSEYGQVQSFDEVKMCHNAQ